MRKTSAEILDYYDEEVVKMISEKYNLLRLPIPQMGLVP